MTRQHYLGIDWSQERHDICVKNETGEIVVEKSIAHSLKGFEEIEGLRQALKLSPGELIIGIETANSLLIDWLWERSYEQIYVIPPSTVDKSRKRFHSSGAKDDKVDARECCDLVRKERSRLLPCLLYTS